MLRVPGDFLSLPASFIHPLELAAAEIIWTEGLLALTQVEFQTWLTTHASVVQTRPSVV